MMIALLAVAFVAGILYLWAGVWVCVLIDEQWHGTFAILTRDNVLLEQLVVLVWPLALLIVGVIRYVRRRERFDPRIP